MIWCRIHFGQVFTIYSGFTSDRFYGLSRIHYKQVLWFIQSSLLTGPHLKWRKTDKLLPLNNNKNVFTSPYDEHQPCQGWTSFYKVRGTLNIKVLHNNLDVLVYPGFTINRFYGLSRVHYWQVLWFIQGPLSTGFIVYVRFKLTRFDCTY
jgi:hypothetical protein